jgi:predicted signal transduction protein with EAL and GGDEF domain
MASVVAETRMTGRAGHALLGIEMDGLVRVRERFGVYSTDRLLAEAENRVRGCLRTSDELALVTGDGMYVLVASDGDAGGAWHAAELLLSVLTAPYALEDRQVTLTAFVGIALVQPHHRTPAVGTREAFWALERARSVGIARCAAFDAERQATAIEHFRLATELRGAIDRAEFRMHYQPILDCRTGKVVDWRRCCAGSTP